MIPFFRSSFHLFIPSISFILALNLTLSIDTSHTFNIFFPLRTISFVRSFFLPSFLSFGWGKLWLRFTIPPWNEMSIVCFYPIFNSIFFPLRDELFLLFGFRNGSISWSLMKMNDTERHTFVFLCFSFFHSFILVHSIWLAFVFVALRSIFSFLLESRPKFFTFLLIMECESWFLLIETKILTMF